MTDATGFARLIRTHTAYHVWRFLSPAEIVRLAGRANFCARGRPRLWLLGLAVLRWLRVHLSAEDSLGVLLRDLRGLVQEREQRQQQQQQQQRLRRSELQERVQRRDTHVCVPTDLPGLSALDTLALLTDVQRRMHVPADSPSLLRLSYRVEAFGVGLFRVRSPLSPLKRSEFDGVDNTYDCYFRRSTSAEEDSRARRAPATAPTAARERHEAVARLLQQCTHPRLDGAEKLLSPAVLGHLARRARQAARRRGRLAGRVRQGGGAFCRQDRPLPPRPSPRRHTPCTTRTCPQAQLLPPATFTARLLQTRPVSLGDEHEPRTGDKRVEWWPGTGAGPCALLHSVQREERGGSQAACVRAVSTLVASAGALAGAATALWDVAGQGLDPERYTCAYRNRSCPQNASAADPVRHGQQWHALIATQPAEALDRARVEHWRRVLADADAAGLGERPTVLLLQVRSTIRQWQSYGFVLDGHHKLVAAQSMSPRPARLNFLILAADDGPPTPTGQGFPPRSLGLPRTVGPRPSLQKAAAAAFSCGGSVARLPQQYVASTLRIAEQCELRDRRRAAARRLARVREYARSRGAELVQQKREAAFRRRVGEWCVAHPVGEFLVDLDDSSARLGRSWRRMWPARDQRARAELPRVQQEVSAAVEMCRRGWVAEPEEESVAVGGMFGGAAADDGW